MTDIAETISPALLPVAVAAIAGLRWYVLNRVRKAPK
jgi:hypothetical protein